MNQLIQRQKGLLIHEQEQTRNQNECFSSKVQDWKYQTSKKEKIRRDSQKELEQNLNHQSQQSQNGPISISNNCESPSSHENFVKILNKNGYKQLANNVTDLKDGGTTPFNKSQTPNNQSLINSTQTEIKSFKFNKRLPKRSNLPPIINNNSKVSLQQPFQEPTETSQNLKQQFAKNPFIKLNPMDNVRKINVQIQYCSTKNSNIEFKQQTYLKNSKAIFHSEPAIQKAEVYSSFLRIGLASEVSNQERFSNHYYNSDSPGNANISGKDSSASLISPCNRNERQLGFKESTISLDQELSSPRSYHFNYGTTKKNDNKNNSNDDKNQQKINKTIGNSLKSELDTYRDINSFKAFRDSRNINSILVKKDMMWKLEVLRKLNDLQKSRCRTPIVLEINAKSPLIKRESLFKKQK